MNALVPLRPAALEGEVLGPEARVRVIAMPNAFKAERVMEDLPAGLSIEELLTEAIGHVPRSARVWLGKGEQADEEIPRRYWRNVRPKPGTRLTCRAVPLGGGGGGMFRNLLLLGVVLAAAFFAPYLAGALAPGLSTASMGFAILKGVIGLAITAIGNMLVNALFPVKPPKLADNGDSGKSVYSISGARNQADPWGPVPVVLGRHRLAPKYAANPWTEIAGDEQFLRLLFCVGYGPLELSDLRIGTTPVENFTGIEIEIFEGWPDDAAPTLYPNQVFEQTFDIQMEGVDTGPAEPNPGPWYERTTAEEVNEIGVDFICPRGLYRMDTKGEKEEANISYQVEYRPSGSSDPWVQIVDAFRVPRDSMQPVRFTHKWAVTQGQYDVRCRRNTIDEQKPRLIDEIRWTALRGIKHAPPVNSEKPLALVAMRIQASDQLNGTVDTFNLIAESILPDWDAGAEEWVVQATRNPASCFRAILQGPANDRTVEDEALDLEKLQAWHEQCTFEGWMFDQVRDFRASAYDALTDVASAGRAAVTLRDSRWGVMIYDPDAPVVQLFTPRNTKNFSSQRAYREFPHGWRVRFVNSDNDWQQDERVVYDAGYDEDNATRFESLEFPGVTVPENIWRHGRFHLAQARLRPETYSFTCDFEHLLCTRGDRVRFAHDVPLFGSGVARVRSIDGLVVTLDDLVGMEADKTYCLRVRLASGEFELYQLVTEPGESRVVTLLDSGESPMLLPEPGDLAAFGEIGLESVDLAVLSIEPGPDLTAEVTCVDWAAAIADADTGEIPEYDSQITPPVDLRGRLAPRDLRFSEGLVRAGPVVQSVASLSWQRPSVSGPPPSYEVQFRLSGGAWSTGVVVSQTSHQFINLSGATYDFRVRTLGPENSFSDWSVISGQTIQGLLAPPEQVSGFRIQVVGALATLTWNANPDLDLSHYEIRHVAASTGALWQNGLVLASNVTGTSLQLPARGGTWMIKAVDTSGVYSDDATLIISSISSIAGLNAVELLDEAAPSPPFAGTEHLDTVNVIYDSDLGGIRLDDVDAESSVEEPVIGYYYFDNELDLGAVYTSRLTVTAEVQGLDLEDNFLEVDDVLAMDDVLGAAIDDYEVEVQGRWTDDPLASPIEWSDWQPVVIQDVTARAFQFRSPLSSYRRHVTPLVTQLSVLVDMEDRIAAAEDVAIANTGETITFSQPFKETPAVVVTIQDAATGDYAEITNKSAAGFDLIVKNSGGSGVSRVVDWHAQGYGVQAA